jgi:hypothetical protein
MGAFDRDAGPDCQPQGYAVTSGGYIPPSAVYQPPDPLPLPDNRPRLLVPGGSGTLMEIGGDQPSLTVPAGGGKFMGMPYSRTDPARPLQLMNWFIDTILLGMALVAAGSLGLSLGLLLASVRL